MIQIEEEKIAEMMFDIWHNSDSLKNPVMVGEYIANKLKEAIIVTRCCTELCECKGSGGIRMDGTCGRCTKPLEIHKD